MLELRRFSEVKDKDINIIISTHYNHWSRYSDFMNIDDTTYKFKEIYTNNMDFPIGYALYDDNKLIGFCVIKKDNLKKYPNIYPWISDVMILEEYRNMGYGRMMIALILKEIEKLGYKNAYLWTDKAPGFYKKLGFKFKMMVEKNNNEGFGELYYKEIKEDYMKKTLVAYFSCTGITKKVAQKLNSLVKGDLFEIVPKVPYTKEDLDWMDKESRTTKEMNDKTYRPEIARTIDNMDDYDIVYLGFPIWWYVAPRIIDTFLESYDFSGKIVIPFATSGSSGMGDTDIELHKLCSNKTNWKESKRFDKDVNEEELKVWLDSLNI